MEEIEFKNVISAAELVRLGWRPHGWLLWQMVPQGGITLLAGETASGKSFLGLDLALGVASGRGSAWDMEIGEPIADSSSLVADRKKTGDSSWLVGDRKRTGDSSWSIAHSSWLVGDREEETLSASLLGQAENSEDSDFPMSYQLPPMSCEALPPISYQLSPMSCKARVRYFCADADPNLIAERVLRLCRGYPTGKKGMGIDVPDALDLDFTAHAFSDPESFRWLQKEVLRRGYQLLIFDGLAQYLPGMADGSASAVGAFLRGLRQLTSQTGVSVVLIHQFNKRQAARLDKWGIPTSQGEERVRGSSELLAGVDSVLLLSRPEAMKLGGMGRNVLKVVKNRLGQAGARLQFTIVDGEPTNADGDAHNTLCQGASEGLRSSLHLLFERLGEQALPKPRRLADAAFDEMMRILMTEDERKFDRAGLIKLLQDRMNLPSTRSLTEAFRILGKDERVRVERDESGKKCYSWAVPGTGALERKVYGLPPAMALDVASSYLLSKARLNLAEQEIEKMQNKTSSTGLVEQLGELLRTGDESE